jgi:cytidine deaminase
MTTTFLSPEALLAQAEAIAKHSYSPYIKFAVGAACQLVDGSVVSGANVQYPSPHIWACAENAMLSAYVASGKYPMPIVAVAVWAEKTPNHYITPCGSCRQALAEFLKPEAPVYVAHPTEPHAVKTFTMGELLPHQFTLET